MMRNMTALLTLNGIPPQVVGGLNTLEQIRLRTYVTKNEENWYYFYQYNNRPFPGSIRPFTDIVSRILDRFISWGAQVEKELYHTGIAFFPIEKGETTFKPDFNLHQDKKDAQSILHEKNTLVLRFLCASSVPPHCVDLTSSSDMDDILNRHRIKQGGRVFDRSLFEVTKEQGGSILVPKDWDIIVFDGITPHLPQPAIKQNQRILMNAWYEIKLPENWHDRVRNGNVPIWVPKGTPQP